MWRHVVALDAQRGVGQTEGVLQLVESPGPAVVVGRPLEPVADELLLGVLRDRGLQLPLVAALRYADGDLRAAQRRQPLLVERRVVHLGGHEHRLRDAEGRVVVQALEHGADQLAGRDVLDLVEHEALPTRDPAVADEEDLHRRLELVLHEAEHVEVLRALGHHLLLLDGLLDAGEPVPETGRLLELEVVGGRPHLLAQPSDHHLGVAVEEVDQLLRVAGVLLLGDLADAGSGALLDVEQQARPAEAGVVVELVLRAGAEGERAQEQVERLADGVGVAVGPEVADALALAPPHHHRARPLLVEGDGQERVALVVLQPDVEPRLVLLDEAELEHERLDVVADLDPLDRLGGGHHRRRAGREAGGVHEVVREPRPQRMGLAHVDDPTVLVLELVRAGGVGDRAGRRTLDHHRRGYGYGPTSRWVGSP